jgi:hypothetical protein
LAAIGIVMFGQLGTGGSSQDDEPPVVAGAEPSESTQSESTAVGSEEESDPASAAEPREAEGEPTPEAPPEEATETASESSSAAEDPREAEESGRGEGSRRGMMAERRPRERGSLAINTTPWSRVYLGRRLLGQTPLEATVPSGRSRLKLVDPEGHTFYRTVEVRPNGTSRVSFDLSR